MNKQPITLATLPQATEQEVFDQVANHLLTQNKKCIGKLGTCKYHAGGLMCAAGVLISEEEYNIGTTSDGTNLFEANGGWFSLVCDVFVPDAHASLIGKLQIIHHRKYPSEWRWHLISLATNLKLSTDNLIPEQPNEDNTSNDGH